LILALIGGIRKSGRKVGLLALPFAAGMAFLPNVLIWFFGHVCPTFGNVPGWLPLTLGTATAVFFGVMLFGAYLSLLTALGLEHTQAFTALDHPGYKHFLRLRVRADGTGIDGYCIGLTDPVAPNDEPRLVDVFHWRPETEESLRSMRPQPKPSKPKSKSKK
jgi:hypothetical protein